MKEFILENGKKVKEGDHITIYDVVNDPLGESCFMYEILLNQKSISMLIEEGVLREACEHDIPTDVNFYIKKIADKMNWDVKRTYKHLCETESISPAAVLSILLKEIATELDKKYDDHIKDSPEIYVISLFDGRVTKANKSHIKNYRNFAAFRSIDDAKIACRTVKHILKGMFKDGK